jgi:hypothetical protein
VGLREKHDKLTVDALTPLRGDVNKLLAQLRLLAEEQAYLEARDVLHRASARAAAQLPPNEPPLTRARAS